MIELIVNGIKKNPRNLSFFKFKGDINFFVLIEIKGKPTSSESSLKISTYKTEKKKEILNSEINWGKKKGNFLTKLDNDLYFYNCDGFDHNCNIICKIKSLDNDLKGELSINYGPVKVKQKIISNLKKKIKNNYLNKKVKGTTNHGQTTFDVLKMEDNIIKVYKDKELLNEGFINSETEVKIAKNQPFLKVRVIFQNETPTMNIKVDNFEERDELMMFIQYYINRSKKNIQDFGNDNNPVYKKKFAESNREREFKNKISDENWKEEKFKNNVRGSLIERNLNENHSQKFEKNKGGRYFENSGQKFDNKFLNKFGGQSAVKKRPINESYSSLVSLKKLFGKSNKKKQEKFNPLKFDMNKNRLSSLNTIKENKSNYENEKNNFEKEKNIFKSENNIHKKDFDLMNKYIKKSESKDRIDFFEIKKPFKKTLRKKSPNSFENRSTPKMKNENYIVNKDESLSNVFKNLHFNNNKYKKDSLIEKISIVESKDFNDKNFYLKNKLLEYKNINNKIENENNNLVLYKNNYNKILKEKNNLEDEIKRIKISNEGYKRENDFLKIENKRIEKEELLIREKKENLMRSQYNKLNNKYKTLKNDLENIKDLSERKENIIYAMKGSITNFQNEKYDLKNLNKELTEKINSLKEKENYFIKKIDFLKESEIGNLKKKNLIENLKDKLENKDYDINSFVEHVDLLEKRMWSLKKEKENIIFKLNEKKDIIKNLKIEINNLENEIVAQKNQNQNIFSNVNKLEIQLKDKNDFINDKLNSQKIEENKKQLIKKINLLKNELFNITNEKNEIKNEKNKIIENYKKLQNKYEEKEIHNLNENIDKINKYKTQNQNLKIENKYFKNDLEILKDQKDLLKNKNEEIYNEIRILKESNIDINDENDNLKFEIKKYDEKLKIIKNKIYPNKENEINIYKNQINTYENRFLKLQENISKLSSDIFDLRENKILMNKNLKLLKRNIKEKNDLIKKLEEEKKYYKNDLLNFEQKLERSKKENLDLINNFENSKNKNIMRYSMNLSNGIKKNKKLEVKNNNSFIEKIKKENKFLKEENSLYKNSNNKKYNLKEIYLYIENGKKNNIPYIDKFLEKLNNEIIKKKSKNFQNENVKNNLSDKLMDLLFLYNLSLKNRNQYLSENEILFELDKLIKEKDIIINEKDFLIKELNKNLVNEEYILEESLLC